MRIQFIFIAFLLSFISVLSFGREIKAETATSSDLVVAAWQALEKGELGRAMLFAEKCIKSYGKQAQKMQAELGDYPDGKKKPIASYWALNDVSTAFYIKAEAMRQSGLMAEAKPIYHELVSKYRYGQCWDPRGWYWKPAQIAQERLRLINLGLGDLGDLRSESLVIKAWNALESNDIQAVFDYTNECMTLYGRDADKMQASLSDFPKGDREEISRYWALNDVATAYFIKGEALRRAGKIEAAKQVFRILISRYRYGQCWEPRGWWWKPSEGALDKLFIMENGMPVDYGDYSSQTLVRKAWEALDNEQLDMALIYTEKCIKLYTEQALKMQSELKELPRGENEEIFIYWAVNDVATAHYIRGRAFELKGKTAEAKKEYLTVRDKYAFGQCWDPKGWWWRPAEAAGSVLKTMGVPEPETARKSN